MKLYLLKEVPKTGQKGDIVEVSEGFGRYLVNQKQATFVTPEVIKQLEQQRVKEKEKNEKDLQKMQEMAARLDGGEVEIETQEKQGNFYAALTPKEISKAIKEQLGVTVKPEQIKIPKPIKEVGEHKVLISFKHGLEAEVKVIVS